jgi:hypothetical protein
MGRSENSRNRIFIVDKNGILKTAPADPAKVKDPSLIIYTAMDETFGRYAVSNGNQTMDALSAGGLHYSMTEWQYEPDSPNFTPRITALIKPKSLSAEISLLKKSPFSDDCERYLYELPITIPGLGHCVTTYSGDGDPLPSFAGDPYLLPLVGNKEKIARAIWNSLNEENKVSLAVKFISVQKKKTTNRFFNFFDIKERETSITVINKYKTV